LLLKKSKNHLKKILLSDKKFTKSKFLVLLF
jgi:hypothetical protein